jgi:DNA replication protein DnaC
MTPRTPSSNSSHSRYEHASPSLTSNPPFSGWGGIFGDQAVAAAMIDRVVHHANVLTSRAPATGYATAVIGASRPS